MYSKLFGKKRESNTHSIGTRYGMYNDPIDFQNKIANYKKYFKTRKLYNSDPERRQEIDNKVKEFGSNFFIEIKKLIANLNTEFNSCNQKCNEFICDKVNDETTCKQTLDQGNKSPMGWKANQCKATASTPNFSKGEYFSNKNEEVQIACLSVSNDIDDIVDLTYSFLKNNNISSNKDYLRVITLQETYPIIFRDPALSFFSISKKEGNKKITFNDEAMSQATEGLQEYDENNENNLNLYSGIDGGKFKKYKFRNTKKRKNNRNTKNKRYKKHKKTNRI